MIIKVLARHNPSYASLIDYLTKEGKGKHGAPVIITHNLRGSTKEAWVKEFMENESFRQYVRKDQIYLYHEIASLHKEENKDLITEDILRDLAQQYVNLRGKEGMYLAAIHEDKDHAHIHFMTSGVKYRTGQAHRLSFKELQELKVNFQEYHKGHYPFLSLSNPEHGKGRGYVTDREYFSKTKRTNVKAQIQEKIQSLYKEATSQQHFLDLLREHNMPHYERKGVPTGIEYEDMKFRFSRLDILFEDMPISQAMAAEEQQALAEIQELRINRSELEYILTPK